MKSKMFALSFVLLLTGCAEEEAKIEAESVKEAKDSIRFKPEVWTDKETGCDYLLIDTNDLQGGTSITPRMKSDGTQYCK